MEIDVIAAVGAVERVVTMQEREGKPARVVRASRSYDTGIDDVWDAITSPDRIPRWFMPITGELRLGGRYQLQGNAGGSILRCEPPRDLGITWEYGGQVGWVDVRLEAESTERTRLTLEHIGHVPDEFWEQYGPGAVGVGWDLGLVGLERYLTTGVSVDPAEAEAWMLSPGGREFVRGSSEGWGAASTVAGTDAAAANAAAQRTTGFYTGEPV